MGMLDDNLDQWKSLVKIYNLTKSLLLKIEEIDESHEFYFPPLIEQRDMLDHIIRALFAHLFPIDYEAQRKDEHSDKYIPSQLGKAIGHSYRALFDAADWLSMIYREEVTTIINRYKISTVHKCLPEYASEIEPRIAEISIQIAEQREGKNIGNEGQFLGNFENYMSLIVDLESYWKTIKSKTGSFNDIEFGSSRGILPE